MKKKLLFVCLGNICRSPAAECIMRQKLLDNKLDSQYDCDSAGTIGYHQGSPPDKRMVNAGKVKNFEISGISRRLTYFDLEKFDYIFAMDDDNFSDILTLDEDGLYFDKIYKITQFSSNKCIKLVPDPYYQGTKGFDLVIDILDDCSSNIIKQLLCRE